MADLIPKDTDEEIERYMEADMIRRARIPMEGNAALKFEADPITKRENAYFPLSSGGYVKIGERAVKPKDTAKTDVLAAARDIQNDARGPISEVMGGAEGPTMADYEAAGFTEAEVLAFQAQEEARRLAHPGMQVPVQLTPEQIQYGVDVGAPMIAPRATTFRDRVRDVAYSGLSEFIDDPNQLRFWSDYLTDVADIIVPGVGGAISTDEGARLFNQGVEQGNAIDMLIGAGLTTLGVAEMVPFVRSLSGPARQALTERLSPAAKNLLADLIGASRAIAQGDKDMLMEIFQPAGTPRSLGAAAPEGAKVKPRMGEAFDDWIDRIYAPENRGPGNVVQDENVVFRAMSPQEAEAGEGAGVFRDLSGQPLYVANDPERYIGGGAYGGKRQGRIYEFDVTGLASEVRQGGVGIQERAISEIPTDRVRRVWEWNPETKAHELIIDNTQPRSLGAAAPEGRAVIRPDDVYRGEGIPRITVRETSQPYVVRGTQQSQIDDMIQSGLVRPKPGGYGAKNSSQLYFGESSEILPTSIFGRPTEERFVLVGDSDKLAGTEGPIPIDQLRHVWAVRDGETVDILPEILRANREFGNTGQ